MDSNVKLTVLGPARIVCDDFLLASNAEFQVDAQGGPVEVYVNNDFVMGSNTLASSLTQVASDLSFFLLSDNIQNEDLVEFDSNSKLYGTIYAPNAFIKIDSNFELFGALVAKRVELNSNSKVHFDEALRRSSTGSTLGGWEVLCWRLAP